MTKRCTIKILRGTCEKQYWEEFDLEVTPFLNITTALLEIQKNPINKAKQKVTPIAWEQGCLEEVCGSCTMLVNGRPRQGCSAIIHKIMEETASDIITLAPMSKFPLIKDLVVDRQSMFDSLKKVRAWIDVDDSYDRGFGPKVSQEVQEVRYELSTCMTCGCCLEACPQFHEKSPFIGAASISQVRLFNADATGKLGQAQRLRPLMEEGGIAACGNAQNCVEVCPKQIPLTDSLAVVNRQVAKQAIKDFLSAPDI